MYEEKLTGKFRHRIMVRLFRKSLMILQVEVEETYSKTVAGLPTPTVTTHYRDASLDDWMRLMEIILAKREGE